MSVEPIEVVIRLWETERITVSQAIGKMLLWLQEHHKRLLRLEAAQSRLAGEVRQIQRK